MRARGSLRGLRTAAPLKRGVGRGELRLKFALRGLRTAAPLKLSFLPIPEFGRWPLRGLRTAAPLKRVAEVRAAEVRAASPRSSDRGSVEASGPGRRNDRTGRPSPRSSDRGSVEADGFREFGLVLVGTLRGLRTAAPLKQLLGVAKRELLAELSAVFGPRLR